MKPFHAGILVTGLGLLFLLSGCCEQSDPDLEPVAFNEEELRRIQKLSPLPDLPPSPTNAFADNPAAADLGQNLFYDSRLSSNGSVACATCHDPEKGFSDGKALSEGLATTDRHSQSLWNVAHQQWFFWDGRTDSLWAQSIQPMLDEREMGASVEHLQGVVRKDTVLRAAYQNLFGELGGHSSDRFLSNLGKCFEAFERKLISTNSEFDRFVEGLEEEGPDAEPGDVDETIAAVVSENPAEPSAGFSEAAKRGLQIFVGRGQCVLCHDGPNFSDGEFHNIGLPLHPELPKDSGRFVGIRKVKDDRFNGLGEFSDDRGKDANIKLEYVVVKMNNLAEFKTPSLRNVAETAPYMHDGRFKTLREVLQFYSRLRGSPPVGHREETLKPLRFSKQEMRDLEAFLRSLTGDPVDESLKLPVSLGGE